MARVRRGGWGGVEVVGGRVVKGRGMRVGSRVGIRGYEIGMRWSVGGVGMVNG